MNPIVLIRDAGHGETPACPAARFTRGDVVRVRRTKALVAFPPEAVVLVAIPPGFSPDYALADLMGEPRPLMIREGRRTVAYILANDGDATPYWAREADLLVSGKPPIEIGTIARGPTCANHPDRVSRTNLDGDELCQEYADAWVRGEGQAAADREADEQEGKAP